MFKPQIKYIFLAVTLLIATFDSLMVWVIYQSSKDALFVSLENEGRQVHESYEIIVEQVGTFMEQTATYIASDSRVNQLFLAGRKAVDSEGKGPGGHKSAQIRQELLALLSDGWHQTTNNYQARQLHFHLPPAYSFLRVHAPEKFGDDLSLVRHIIVDVNKSVLPAKGYESGRTYSGIRGVVPVYAFDNGLQKKVHVGALEVGISFESVLEDLKDTLGADFAVLMDTEHVQKTMWSDYYARYSQTHAMLSGLMLDVDTGSEITQLVLNHKKVAPLLEAPGTRLIYVNKHPYSVTSFALRDYRGNINPERQDIGRVVVWQDVQKEVVAHNKGVNNSIIVAIIGFVVIELLVCWGLRLQVMYIEKQEESLLDSLTNIPNRRAFDELAPELLNSGKRDFKDLSLIFLDVDNYKKYNDAYGHVQGDRCLKRIAGVLHSNLKRANDFVARFGGEEFVVILFDVKLDKAIRVADRLRASIKSQNIPHKENDDKKVVTISCGVAHVRLTPKSKITLKTLMERADKALYKAKEKGRNRTVAAPD